MKFLVDAQSPKLLCDLLCSKGHDAIHALDLPEKNKTHDGQIIEISVRENRVVITKDNDFLESFLLFGVPPKLILVRTGNIYNSDLLNIFEQHINSISNLLLHNSLVEINTREIVIHL